MKKIIYFIRHGESDANVNPNARSRNPLTEKGHQQAKIVANRFKNIPLDIIIETSKVRSKQTAEAVGLLTGVPIIENDLFIEREGEFEIMWEFKHLSVAEITENMRTKLNKPNWEYDKQELFITLRERIKKAIGYLEDIQYKNIVIVTHGAFLKVLIAYLLLRETLSEEQAVLFMKHSGINNTGITVCKFNSEIKEWRLITWNDQAHL